MMHCSKDSDEEGGGEETEIQQTCVLNDYSFSSIPDIPSADHGASPSKNPFASIYNAHIVHSDWFIPVIRYKLPCWHIIISILQVKKIDFWIYSLFELIQLMNTYSASGEVSVVGEES